MHSKPICTRKELMQPGCIAQKRDLGSLQVVPAHAERSCCQHNDRKLCLMQTLSSIKGTLISQQGSLPRQCHLAEWNVDTCWALTRAPRRPGPGLGCPSPQQCSAQQQSAALLSLLYSSDQGAETGHLACKKETLKQRHPPQQGSWARPDCQAGSYWEWHSYDLWSCLNIRSTYDDWPSFQSSPGEGCPGWQWS